MESSPLLIVGVLLLVVVLGLSLWQRSQQVDRTGAGRSAPGGAVASASPAAPAAVATAKPDSSYAFVRDDLLGVLDWDEGVWNADDNAAFADTEVIVEIHADKSGFTNAQREIVRTALASSHDLDERARALIGQQLQRDGITDMTMEAYELTVRHRDDGLEAGFVWYDVAKADREMGVSSADGWKTLRLETPG